MKGIRCSALQNDFRGLKDDAQYQTFTARYNKLKDNYRTLIVQGILKPVSIFKRKISQLESDTNNIDHKGDRYAGRETGKGWGSEDSVEVVEDTVETVAAEILLGTVDEEVVEEEV